MRKLIVVLMLAISFALGIFSQNLIAGNWVKPSHGTPPPSFIKGSIIGARGEADYNLPSGWKFVRVMPYWDNGKQIRIFFQKLE